MNVRAAAVRLTVAALLSSVLPWVTTAAATAAVSPSGVWTWGVNSDGQLGDGTFVDRLSPGAVPGLDGIVDIHGGREHVAALDQDGQVWTWGSNAEGQLGIGGSADSPRPVAVPGLSDVVAVETGHNFIVALKSNGTVWASGLNSDGQLGDGTTTMRRTPVQVSGLVDAVAIAAGRDMTYAVRANGQLVGWGRNAEGQLGDGSTTARRTPVRVGQLADVRRVAGGRDHGLAVLGDGSVWAWGDNAFGQVGDGTLTNRVAPVRVLVSGGADVAAGAHHSFALRGDGSVASWGRNYRSALGDGTGTQRTRPVSVVGVSEAVSIGAGRDTGVVTLSDGRVQVWGHNAYGQLGDGTMTDRRSAVYLPGLSNAVKAGGGGSGFQVVLVGESVEPSPNVAPVARIGEPQCEGLVCDFSGEGSSDPDGQVTGWEWVVGGQASSGVTTRVRLPAAGQYEVVLTVSDDDGATGTTSTTVTVEEPPTTPEPPVLTGASSANASATAVSVGVPAGVSEGDRLVLVVSLNGSAEVSPGTGWSRLAAASDGTEVTSSVWQRSAPPGATGATVRVTLSRQVKATVTLAGYAGAAPLDVAVAGVTGSTSTVDHVAPALTVPGDGSVLLRAWADKASADRTWSAPTGTQVLGTSYGSGGGSVAALVAQQAVDRGVVAAGVARSTVASSKAVTWSVVIPPQ